eukprot:2259858-Pleurochrysis_carterae.AAC.2
MNLFLKPTLRFSIPVAACCFGLIFESKRTELKEACFFLAELETLNMPESTEFVDCERIQRNPQNSAQPKSSSPSPPVLIAHLAWPRAALNWH